MSELNILKFQDSLENSGSSIWNFYTNDFLQIKYHYIFIIIIKFSSWNIQHTNYSIDIYCILTNATYKDFISNNKIININQTLKTSKSLIYESPQWQLYLITKLTVQSNQKYIKLSGILSITNRSFPCWVKS